MFHGMISLIAKMNKKKIGTVVVQVLRLGNIGNSGDGKMNMFLHAQPLTGDSVDSEIYALPIPKSIADRLERIQRNFLWGATKDMLKFLLVAWDKVCLPVEAGSLGIMKIGRVNQALLGSDYDALGMKLLSCGDA